MLTFFANTLRRSISTFTKTKCGLYIENGLPPTFSKILIANRGEIACRVMRTCKLLGVATVAIYSDADADSMHVRMADEAYRIGLPPSKESYLRAEAIIELAKSLNAQAIHPGYGFLSESEFFCKLCEEQGIVFIGPPVDAIRAMGSKSASKNIMIKAGVPVVPGYHGEDQSIERLKEEAHRIGFPIMMKAVLGGGGKGMRICRSENEFEELLNACKRESMNHFRDDRILLERYVSHPRHIEFQVFGDNFGDAVHLFERDCSVQRRHQKVLEESPAPGMTPERRAIMGKSAVDATKAVGYAGAGTVEFLVDAETDDYFFMEMNTRLQVEHPVTEMVVKRDLVQWQLHVASGHPLPAKQNEITGNDYAIEARIYAEDPRNGFLPMSGHIHHFSPPKSNEFVRVETGVKQGDEVSVFYDPMIAKLLTTGSTRISALQKMHRALQDFHIVGLPTNIPFLLRSVLHPEFIKGQVGTGFIESNLEELIPPPVLVPNDVVAMASLALLTMEKVSTSSNVWDAVDCFKLNSSPKRKFSLLDGGEDSFSFDIGIENSENDHYKLKFDDYQVDISGSFDPIKGTLIANLGDKICKCKVVFVANDIYIFYNEETFHLKVPVKTFSKTESDDLGSVSPMPGKIVKLNVGPNDTVSKGDVLLVMEAMKMEHIIRAPTDGIVENILCEVGEFVKDKKLLVSFKKE